MKFRLLFIILGVCYVSLVYTQENLSAEIMQHLTEAQRNLLEQEKQQMIKNREAFKATLSEQQKQILRDKNLSKDAMRAQLRATFTQEQKSLLNIQQESLRETRDAFRKSLTNEQKEMVKDHLDKTRETKDREEIRQPRGKDKKRPPHAGGPGRKK